MEDSQGKPGAASKEFRALLGQVIAEHSEGNYRDFAADAGWSHTTFYEIMKGQRRPSPPLVERLAEMFPRHGAAFYRTAGRPVPARYLDEGAAEMLAAYLEPEEVDYLAAEAERRRTSPGTVLREAVARYRAESSEDNPVADVPCRHARCSSFKHGLDHVITPNPPRLAAAA